MWRIIMSGKGISKSELETWEMDDVMKFNALLDMEDDMTQAWRTMLTPEPQGKA